MKKLPKKYQGEFGWVTAAQAIDDGHKLDVQSKYGENWYASSNNAVSKSAIYRVAKKKFQEGWYHYKETIIYRNSHDEWKAVGMVGACDYIDEAEVGEFIK